ncbi:MAG: YraN family protein [Chloroflexi bacterium RBG_16_47_49]|nr:MAG: YraN family protein [Chloroflexi bacterium RBG_16_47_49]
MKSGHRQSIGHIGESIAATFLKNQGYTILEMNHRTPYGEIDLITQLGNVIVFVEVKTRASRSLGPPEISITQRKAEHMRCAAEYYIQQHPELHNDWRIDALSILLHAGETPPSIDHFENVIN